MQQIVNNLDTVQQLLYLPNALRGTVHAPKSEISAEFGAALKSIT